VRARSRARCRASPAVERGDTPSAPASGPAKIEDISASRYVVRHPTHSCVSRFVPRWRSRPQLRHSSGSCGWIRLERNHLSRIQVGPRSPTPGESGLDESTIWIGLIPAETRELGRIAQRGSWASASFNQRCHCRLWLIPARWRRYCTSRQRLGRSPTGTSTTGSQSGDQNRD
jgi:hypothetical protein